VAESDQTSPADRYDDEIDLRDVFRVLWAGKWLFVGTSSVATVLAIIFSLFLPNVYRAEALLAPSSADQQGGLAALATQYGGLASLAGIDLASGSMSNTAMGLEVLRSRKFIADFVERHDILVPLMAANGWDRSTGTLKLDAGVYDRSTNTWVRDVSPGRKAVPSMQEAYKKFIDLMSISEDSKTGFINIAVEHYSPQIAKQWVDWLVEDINSTLMAKDVEEAEHAIDYLNGQISSTSVAGLQSVFFGLIEEQTKTVMLAKVSPEYMFRTIDPAVVPEEKSKPKRALIAGFGLLLGGIFGVVTIMIRSSFSSSRA
jgi:uncharacterized protein involved in exopolysaccharide biosynthesis